MPRWFIGLLLACKSSTPATELEPQAHDRSDSVSSNEHTNSWEQNLPREAVPGFTGKGPSIFRLLDHLHDSNLSLPDSNIDPDWSRHLPLNGPWLASKNDQSWRIRLPISVEEEIGSGSPRNLQLLKDGKPLPFLDHLNTPRSGQGCWQVRDGWIHVYSLGDPRTWDVPPQLERSAQSKTMDRLNHGTSGQTPADYARASITIGKTTREALLLPAPGTASFEIELPANARLRMGIGIAEIPGIKNQAIAGLELKINGESIWSRKLKVQDTWEEIDLSLSRWAGQHVVLSFESTPMGNAYGDWVALAEPEIPGVPQEEGPRRILVLGLDTLRPDHLGTHGYPKPTSPFLDTLASESLVFEHAWAPAPRTLPSFRTVNTGRWPSLARSAPTLGAMLSNAGFSTAGIVANVHLSPEMGFSDGYGHWRYAHSGDAEDQVDRALTWLEAHAEEDSFLFLHFMDPHIFYLAPEPWTDEFTPGGHPTIPDRYNRFSIEYLRAEGSLDGPAKAFIQGRYDGEISYLDSELSRLVESVDALPGQTTIVLVSDHGEEFWDHGGFEHNHSLYQELTRILFWIRPPKGTLSDGPYRVSAHVSLADLAPTLLEMVGQQHSEAPPHWTVSLSIHCYKVVSPDLQRTY